MNRKRFAWLAPVLVLGVAAPAGADGERSRASTQLSIDAEEQFDNPVGTFTAFGDGFCESGTITSEVTSSVDGRRLNFDVRKIFTCTDGSGSWRVHVEATVEPCDAFDYGTWQITGGTGAYRKVRGEGQLVGPYVPTDSCSAPGVVDHYRGTAKVGSGH
jgi:hypothetical protein